MRSSGKSILSGLLAMAAMAGAGLSNARDREDIRHYSTKKPPVGIPGNKLSKKAAKGTLGIRQGW